MKSLDKNEYRYIHIWLRKTFGHAKRCENCGTKKAERYEWALKRGCTYQRIRKLFKQLCPSCHRKQDITPEARKNMALAKLGKPSNARGKHWRIQDTSKMRGRVPWNKGKKIKKS